MKKFMKLILTFICIMFNMYHHLLNTTNRDSLSPHFPLPEPGQASATIAHLPDEMIKYELESQGIKCLPNYLQRRKQLAAVIDERKYVVGKQPVAMGYKEDLDYCSKYLEAWENQFHPDSMGPNTAESFKIKIHMEAMNSDNQISDVAYRDTPISSQLTKESSRNRKTRSSTRNASIAIPRIKTSNESKKHRLNSSITVPNMTLSKQTCEGEVIASNMVGNQEHCDECRVPIRDLIEIEV
ncbi:hypothetical protein Bhyg_07553 [Pseudolycoriella hygida]|uniref:Uncharacterized protein n=1 Tax=Pseudolycoriella hygida TaxID=35572 RepID=A0A9Q0S429_9DIPT|nr:hypothetical protein Bhyg_07553 [Pseudolycoriella hygida]